VPEPAETRVVRPAPVAIPALREGIGHVEKNLEPNSGSRINFESF